MATILGVAGPSGAESAEPTKPAEAATIPLVVRIDRSAITKFIDGQVEVHQPVDQVVLGTRAVGTSVTSGKVRAELIPDSTEAAFDVFYQGTTATKTVGKNGPAIIHSRSFTDFACSRRILFDPRKGFTADGESAIESETRLIYDHIGATRNLGRRLITRIAQRRANAAHEQARRIADRDNKREVLQGFRHDVEVAVHDANANDNFVPYVKRFFGEDTPLQVFAKSSPDCIQIGIGTLKEKYHPLTALPNRGDRTAPLEIWVHPSLLGDSINPLLTVTAPQTTLSMLSQTKILGALSLQLTPSDASITMALEEGWLVFGLPDTSTAPTAAAAVASKAHH